MFFICPSLGRYTAGYFMNSVFIHGIDTNITPPTTKYATNAPRAASTSPIMFIGAPFQFRDGPPTCAVPPRAGSLPQKRKRRKSETEAVKKPKYSVRLSIEREFIESVTCEAG